MTIRYLLDENVDPIYRTELLRRENRITVWRVGMLDAPPRGTSDPDMIDWCERETFLLITNNRKTMPPHLSEHLAKGHHVPGILILSEHMTVGETINELWLIWATSSGDEYRDTITFLPIGQ